MLAKFEALLALLGLYVLLPKLCFILRFLMKLTKITKKRPLIPLAQKENGMHLRIIAPSSTCVGGEAVTSMISKASDDVTKTIKIKNLNIFDPKL